MQPLQPQSITRKQPSLALESSGETRLLSEPCAILFRQRFLPLHGRAVGPSPVIALFAEGHKQGIPNGVVFWQRVAGNADDNFVLRNVYS
jgi:hypothetical protein